MSLKPDDLAQVILDSIDDDEPPTALYTLNIHEARMLAHAVLNAAREHYTADDLRDTPAGRELMAEAWDKFRESYAAEWEEAYPEAIFPSPAPPPAVVSRESVAASMMRKWAKNLRADPNPFEEGDA